MKRHLRLILLPLIVSILGGCISNTPTDLAFLSVEAVDRHDQAEMGGRAPRRLLLKAQFMSTVDLEMFALDNSYGLVNRAFFCNRPKAYAGISFPYVYWNGTQIPDRNGIYKDKLGAETSITYYIYVSVARDVRGRTKPPEVPFNLQQAPEAICFELGGRNMLGFGYRSNTVVIPKEAIALALQSAPPGIDP